jgi:hypothetical protein
MEPERSLHTTNITRVTDERFKRPYVYRISLPSNGFLYDGRLPGGEVFISPMVAADESLLGSQKSDKVSIIDTLCRRNLVECAVPYEDLLVSDTFYILMCLRNVSYGSLYQFQLQCPQCGVKYHKDVKVPEDMRVTRLSEEDDCEPYPCELPMNGDKLTFRLLRNRDEISIRRYAKSRYQQSVEEGDPAYCIRLATHIETINGEKRDAVQKLRYVENLIAADVSQLKEEIKARDFGADLILNSECPACGFAGEEILPFDANFFRVQRAKPRTP